MFCFSVFQTCQHNQQSVEKHYKFNVQSYAKTFYMQMPRWHVLKIAAVSIHYPIKTHQAKQNNSHNFLTIFPFFRPWLQLFILINRQDYQYYAWTFLKSLLDVTGESLQRTVENESKIFDQMKGGCSVVYIHRKK